MGKHFCEICGKAGGMYVLPKEEGLEVVCQDCFVGEGAHRFAELSRSKASQVEADRLFRIEEKVDRILGWVKAHSGGGDS